MFPSVKLASHCNSPLVSHPHTHHQFVLDGFRGFSLRRRGTLPKPCDLAALKNAYLCHTFHRRLCSTYSNDNTYELSNASSHEGSEESEDSKNGESSTSNE